MHTTLYLLAMCLFAATAVVGHAEEHGKTHADHMEKHFDAEESAGRFDDPARDAWQLPDRVIAALNLKRGQTVADIGAGLGISPCDWRNRRLCQRCMRLTSNPRW